jgi:hypothetical protein
MHGEAGSGDTVHVTRDEGKDHLTFKSVKTAPATEPAKA